MAKEIRIIKTQGQPDQVVVKQKDISLGTRPALPKRKKRQVIPNSPM